MTNSTPPKICIIGAGFSGICAGIKLQQALHCKTFTIYDENEEVGGTWLTHTYPGCGCDIASHLYSLSFEPNPDWTTVYAKQPEILEYLKRVAAKHDLYSRIKFNHRVISSTWDEKINKWRIVVCEMSTNSQSELVYDIVIFGVGAFQTPNVPKEFMSFKGPKMHSAAWDSNVLLDDKIVAVIGSGCSAVQIIPEIEPKIKQLLSFQRHPAWIVPQSQFQFPKLLKMAFAVIPLLQWLYRMFIFFGHELKFSAFKANSTLSKIAHWLGRKHLKVQIPNNIELQNKLTPNYPFGCKRVSPSSTYFKSLDSSKAEVIKSRITEVRDHSIVTEDGNEYQIDVLILATGYRVQDSWGLKLIAKNSTDILSEWKEHGPIHYLGISLNSCPNLFAILGPNSGYGHNSVVFAIECQVNWIVQVIKEMQKNNSKVVSVKKSAEKKYTKRIQETFKGTVWEADCGSWYKDANGIITALYPGSLISYWKETRYVDFSKLNFQ